MSNNNFNDKLRNFNNEIIRNFDKDFIGSTYFQSSDNKNTGSTFEYNDLPNISLDNSIGDINRYSIEIFNTDKNENIFPGEFDKEEDNKIEEISQKEKNKVTIQIDNSSPIHKAKNKKNEENNNINKINTTKKKEKGQKNIREDYLTNKIKAVVLKIVMDFINQKLKEKFGKNGVGKGINYKKLYKINSKQTSNAKADYNQNFIYKTLKDIYSVDISTRKKGIPSDKNKILICYLLTEEKNLEIKGYFQNLFNLRFIECVRHFVSQSKKDENYKMELDGLKLFNDLIKNDPSKLNIKEEDMNDEVYLAYYDNFINNYEKIIMGKKARKRVPKKNNKCQSKK
jgi:hypothetical protein